MRKLLYEATNSILTRSRETFALEAWAMKIAKRRGLKKARVALARRLAVITHATITSPPPVHGPHNAIRGPHEYDGLSVPSC